MVTAWLDEEWTPLEVHAQLGQAAGDAYVKCRQQGDDDMSSLVVGLASELLPFNYRETFTSAFEVRAPGAAPKAVRQQDVVASTARSMRCNTCCCVQVTLLLDAPTRGQVSEMVCAAN